MNYTLPLYSAAPPVPTCPVCGDINPSSGHGCFEATGNSNFWLQINRSRGTDLHYKCKICNIEIKLPMSIAYSTLAEHSRICPINK